MQDRRRAWCKLAATANDRPQDNAVGGATNTLPDLSHFLSANYSSVDDSAPVNPLLTPEEQQNSVFYLTEKGELNDKSFVCEFPAADNHEIIASSKNDNEQQQHAVLDSPKPSVVLRKKGKYSIP